MQKQDLYQPQNPTTTNDFDYHRMDIVSPRSITINDDTIASSHRRASSEYYARTPSPAYLRLNSTDDRQTEILSTPRYSDYDNRPIKPLDQNMLQTKLNQYPIDR